MKKKIILTFLIFLIASCSIGFGSYIIENLTINGADENVQVNFEEDKINYKKIEFYDNSNSLLKTMYLKSGDTISLFDAPYYYDGSNYYEWKSSDGSVSLNPIEKDGFSENISVSRELKLSASIAQVNSTLVDNSIVTTDTDTNRGDVSIDSSNNSISFNQKTENLIGDTTSEPINVIKVDEPYLNNVDLSMTFKIGDSNEIENKVSETNIQANSDITIGLEDPTSVGEYADDDYKPIPSGGKNYCVNRMILESDLILLNGSNIEISALTSFYGDNNSFSQYNYQGFITGPYSELDLNGHTLVVSSGCTIKAIGSITDTSDNKTGKIIVEDGGSISATFVVEDQHHESSAPMTYLMGGPIFSMYRMPYLNVPIYFKNGSTFNGILKMDWGGSNKSNTSENIINIIGKSSSIFTFNGESGYISIKPSYDQNLKNSLSSSEVAFKNIMYQTIRIELINADISVNLPTNLSTSISDMDFVINFNKTPFNIPPYFDIYLLGSRCEFYNMITFMPGSSLNVGQNSELVFSTKGFQHFSGFYVALMVMTIEDQYYTSSAGLNFIYEKYDFSEAVKRNDSSDQPASSDVTSSNFFGGTAEIYLSTANFWKYVNKLHAFAKIDGKITFNPISNIDDGSYIKYNLGGIINISNLDDFVKSVNDCKKTSNCIEFYASTFKSGPDRLTQKPGMLAEESRRFNINDFYSNPVVSNGKLLTDVLNVENIVTTNNQTYDFVSGIAESNGLSYGLFPVTSNYDYNYSILNLRKSNYKSESNYRSGYNDSKCDFIKVNLNTDGNFVNINDKIKGNSFSTKTFAFFRGCFVPFNGTKLNIRRFRVRKLYKFLAWDRKFESIDLLYDASYKSLDSYYGHGAWRLS